MTVRGWSAGDALHRLAVAGAALAALVAGGACGLFDVPPPESARVILQGTRGTSVHMVTSTDFEVERTVEGPPRLARLVQADTARVVVPSDTRYDIRKRMRFYVRVFDVDSAAPVVNMQVYINDRLDYDATRNILQQPLEYLYTSFQ